MNPAPLPHFFLYGEPNREADPHFIHVEDLATRSRPGNWQIAPHKHSDLNHLLLIAEGGGTIRFDAEVIPFEAPVLLAVPAHCVHGFSWQRESRGHVLTLADVQLRQVLAAYGELADLFARPRCIALDRTDAAAIDEAIAGIAQELSWVGLGQSAAIHAGLLGVLVRAARRLQQAVTPPEGDPRRRELVARFRQLVESRYRLREPVSTYARALGVSETSLREACAAAGQTPSSIRDRRAVLEAQRLLAFSALSVAQVGDSVGFADPAYFSRFFTRHCGIAPAQWRSRARQQMP
ncbi:helix-turn-helix domain-containing protein [Alteraurantiacibacter palmitatis]|uniref:Helix-turn-helix domain-containing protein n=1 Tax=Alteraurantiacibacter palmitatis TaxID=2054628 RepID=A0ABV7E9M2_9SPHN